MDDEFVIAHFETHVEAAHLGIDHRVDDRAQRPSSCQRVELRHEPAVHAGGMMTVSRDAHRRDAVVRQCGDQVLGRGLGHDEHCIAIDGCLTVEQTAEMLDVTDAHRPSFELDPVDNTGIEEPSTEGRVRGPFGVVDHAAVDVHEHLGIDLEHDLPGEGALASFVERHPAGLRSDDRQ